MLQRIFSHARVQVVSSSHRPSRTGHRLQCRRFASRMDSAQAAMGPMATTIQQKLHETFAPLHFEIVNESYKHSVPKGSESHFKIIIVSDKFEGKSLVEQHRMVNETLKTELKTGVHALSLKTMPTTKWQQTQQTVTHETPNCMGGSKHDKQQQ